MNLISPSEHQLLVFWVQLGVIVTVARLLGQAMKRVGQPAVVGELAAGVILGPSLLGKVWPSASEWLFPLDVGQSGMLMAIGWLGVVFLVIATGYETDLELIGRLGRAAVLVSTGSLVVPLAMGLAVGVAIPSVFLGAEDERITFALFMATALSISSLPVIAKIMSDMGLMRRNFGQLTLAAGMANDVVGWLLLGVIAGIATAGSLAVGALAATVAGMVVFIAASFTVGQRLVDQALRQLMRREAGLTGQFTVIVLVSFGLGAVTQWLGVEAVLGAFVGGILLGRSKFQPPRLIEGLETVTTGFFAPVFFATAGLRVDLGLLGRGEVALWALIVVAVASISKFVGAWAGARLAGLPGREGTALGAGLNARGALEIVIATVGLQLGVLNRASYTVVVIMAIATSMMAPPLLRAVVRTWQGSAEEQDRLRREETLSRNLLVNQKRLLLPSQGGPNSIVAAQVAHLAWPLEADATILTVGSETSHPDLTPLLNVFEDRQVTPHHVVAGDPVRVIAGEASLGYGVVAVGATDGPGPGRLLSPVVDELLRVSRVPLLIARRARLADGSMPAAFGRALVPVSGTRAARAAEEVAYNIGVTLGTEIVLLHVVSRLAAEVGGARPFARFRRRAGATTATTVLDRTDMADAVVDQALALAADVGARATTAVRTGASPGEEIVAAAAELDCDLVVLGANLRRIAGDAFLGHTVEHVLDASDATVVVVALPDGAAGG